MSLPDAVIDRIKRQYSDLSGSNYLVSYKNFKLLSIIGTYQRWKYRILTFNPGNWQGHLGKVSDLNAKCSLVALGRHTD